MLERGWLGEKRGQGFYKRVGKEKEIYAIDLKTLEYHPAEKVAVAVLDGAGRPIEDLGLRLRALLASGDGAPGDSAARAAQFLWPLLRDLFLYSAQMAPQIADRIVEIDRAMRWGYAFQLGPFEIWDALGVPETSARMKNDGCAVPAAVEGVTSFYQAADRGGVPGTRYIDLPSGVWRDLEARSGVLSLKEIKRARGVVKSNPASSLVDLGDGVLCLELHSHRNELGEYSIRMAMDAVAELEGGWEGLVIGNQGENFSIGASLARILAAAREGRWEELGTAVAGFQLAGIALKYAPKPVVAAPFGMALGGGCEMVLWAARAQAAAETYMGLVETGVGLVPAGGGCKEMLLRLGDARQAFELIGYGKTSASAAHAREFGLLRAADGISMNPERLLGDAKSAVLAMAPDYVPGTPRTDIVVEGEAGYALLKLGLYMAREGGYITEYDTVVGEKLAYVLSGGRAAGRPAVSEQFLLDLEREAFLSLCGQAKTQERMEHMLKSGKPLRN
jgi:3-hydroxyacyl-CoA dehydrogenase